MTRPRFAGSPVGNRLRSVREIAGLSARELDRLASLAVGHSSLIESGVVRSVTARTLGKLGRVLGVSIDWLETGAGPMRSKRAITAAVEAARGKPASPSA